MNIASANIASYRLVSGSFYKSSDTETWYKTTIIGRGDDAPTDSDGQTTQVISVTWAHGFGTFDLPSDAIVTSIKCVISVDTFWNESYSGYFTGTLYNGDTAISDSVNYSYRGSGQSHAFTLKTINATTIPSVADINAGNIELRNYCPPAWCGKIFGATLYISFIGHNGIFNMVTLKGGGESLNEATTRIRLSNYYMTLVFDHMPERAYSTCRIAGVPTTMYLTFEDGALVSVMYGIECVNATSIPSYTTTTVYDCSWTESTLTFKCRFPSTGEALKWSGETFTYKYK